MESLYCKQYHMLNNLFKIKKKQPGSISFPLLMLIHPLYCKQYPIFNEFLEEEKTRIDIIFFSLYANTSDRATHNLNLISVIVKERKRHVYDNTTILVVLA